MTNDIICYFNCLPEPLIKKICIDVSDPFITARLSRIFRICTNLIYSILAEDYKKAPCLTNHYNYSLDYCTANDNRKIVLSVYKSVMIEANKYSKVEATIKHSLSIHAKLSAARLVEIATYTQAESLCSSFDAITRECPGANDYLKKMIKADPYSITVAAKIRSWVEADLKSSTSVLASHLVKLQLVNHRFSFLPPEVFQLTHLTQIYILACDLKRIPDEITQLTNLNFVEFPNNLIDRISPQIGALTNIQKLNISSNNLNTIPQEIFNLTNLTDLNLYRIALQKLNPEISQLQKLRCLDISFNRLTTLPLELNKLTNLTALSIWDNDFIVIPKALLESPIDAIKNNHVLLEFAAQLHYQPSS
jgi:hypothetical protein